MKLYYMMFVLLLVPWTAKAQNKNANYIATMQVIGNRDTLTSIEYYSDFLNINTEKEHKSAELYRFERNIRE